MKKRESAEMGLTVWAVNFVILELENFGFFMVFLGRCFSVSKWFDK